MENQKPVRVKKKDAYFLVDNSPSILYYIAVVSLLNSLVFSYGKRFYGVLGVSTYVTFLFQGSWTSHAINAAIACVFAGLGYFISKGYDKAYLAGMILYAADGLVMLIWRGDLFEVFIHIFVLFLLGKGWSGLRASKADGEKMTAV